MRRHSEGGRMSMLVLVKAAGGSKERRELPEKRGESEKEVIRQIGCKWNKR